MLAAFGLAWLGLVAIGPSPLSLDSCLARSRPGAEELETEAQLADVRRALAETSSRLAEDPTVAASAGPRRNGSSTAADVQIDLDVPLLSAAGPRRDLGTALRDAEILLPRAALVERRRVLARAYVDAWLAESRLDVRRRDVRTVERWREVASRRVSAGAEAGFELDLVDLELEQAAGALAQAESEHRRAWAELASLVEGAAMEEPETLTEPPAFTAPSVTLPADSVLVRAIDARRALELSLVRLELARSQSRFALRSSLAREGEEEVALVGLAYRWPRQGVRAAGSAVAERRIASFDRQAELERAALRTRHLAAVSAVRAGSGNESPVDTAHPLMAIERRLEEGKVHPSEGLTQKRLLLAAEQARLERRAAWLLAGIDLQALAAEVEP
jgi:outer membrane protein TolC